MDGFMEKYMETVDSIGQSILTWADPENNFRGHTEVGWRAGKMPTIAW